MRCDLLIRNGLIYDGSGAKPFTGSVAVRGGRICAVGADLSVEAEHVIDAQGLAVCPGFIDPHTHEEIAAVMGESFENFLRQGVTTVVDGNCGHSVTPGTAADAYAYSAKMGMTSERARKRYLEEKPDWAGVSGFADRLRRNGGCNINHALLLGHGIIRWYVMGGFLDRKPTADEMRRMQECIREGMEQGAVGLSTGLAYVPGRYADTDELVTLAETVKTCDGIMASHLRLQNGDIAALAEGIEIAERSGVRFEVSHYSPEYPEGFELIADACARGLEIGADIVPKSSGHFKRRDCLIAITMGNSDRLAGKTMDDFHRALRTPEGRADVLNSIRYREQTKVVKTGDPSMEGKLVSQIAAERGMDAGDLMLEMLENGSDELTFWQGELVRASAPGKPYTGPVLNCGVLSAGSDHIGGDVDVPEVWYELFRNGAFPIFFDCMRRSGLEYEEIVRRVTSAVAGRFRFSDRGLIRESFAADLTVVNFNAFTYPDEAHVDYCNPNQMASGVKDVIVNGVPTVEDGELLSALSGKCISTYGRIL